MTPLFENSELKLLGYFYLEKLVSSSFMLLPAFMVVYFVWLNFSIFQIGILTASLLLSSILFEIPTGAIADLYGRKMSVMIGYVLEGIALLSLFVFKEYYTVLILFIFWGFAKTFSSGSKEAWIVDIIKGEKKKCLHNFFMKEDSIEAVGLILSGIVGAFLVKIYGLSTIWILSSASFFISVILLMNVKEVKELRDKRINGLSQQKIKSKIKEAYKYIKRHSVLFYYLIASLFLAVSVTFGETMTWVPLLKDLNFPDYAFGYMWSALSVVFVIAPLLSKKLLMKGKEKEFIIKYTILPAMILVLIIFVHSWGYALMILLFSSFFFSLREPVRRVYFQRYIPSRMRATITSVNSMIFSLGGAISMPIAGYLVDKLSAKYVILISAITIIPAIVSYSLMNPKDKKRR